MHFNWSRKGARCVSNTSFGPSVSIASMQRRNIVKLCNNCPHSNWFAKHHFMGMGYYVLYLFLIFPSFTIALYNRRLHSAKTTEWSRTHMRYSLFLLLWRGVCRSHGCGGAQCEGRGGGGGGGGAAGPCLLLRSRSSVATRIYFHLDLKVKSSNI